MNTAPTVENQLALPVVEPLGDGVAEFPRLDLADLMAWANEVKTARRVEAESRLRADTSLSPYERQRLVQQVVDADIEIGHLMQRGFTPAGVRKVLVTSLKKAKKTDAEALAVLNQIHFTRQAAIAQDVMSPPAPPKETVAADPPQGDGAGTGV